MTLAQRTSHQRRDAYLLRRQGIHGKQSRQIGINTMLRSVPCCMSDTCKFSRPERLIRGHSWPGVRHRPHIKFQLQVVAYFWYVTPIMATNVSPIGNSTGRVPPWLRYYSPQLRELSLTTFASLPTINLRYWETDLSVEDLVCFKRCSCTVEKLPACGSVLHSCWVGQDGTVRSDLKF